RRTVALLDSFTAPITRATFTGDGRRLVTGHEDGTIHYWASASGQLEWSLAGHRGSAVTCLALSDDGQHLASGLADGTYRVWRPEQFETIGLYRLQNALQVLAIAPNGS